MASKLAVSRLQRDLSDSSLLRNIGTGVGHSLLALRARSRASARSRSTRRRCAPSSTDAWEVLAEAVQTVMRKRGGEDPYEQLKALTRGARIDREALRGSCRGSTSTRPTASGCSS